MADQADGSIIIDTEINSDGFKAGSAELLAAIKALSTEVKNRRQKYRSCKPPSKNYRIPTATERLRRKQLHRR